MHAYHLQGGFPIAINTPFNGLGEEAHLLGSAKALNGCLALLAIDA